MERSRGLPVVARLALAVAVIALGAGVLYVATGGLGRIAGALGSSIGGFLDTIVATPSPSPSQLVAVDAPVIAPPSEPYTNAANVDLVVSIPANVAGRSDTSVRIYLALSGQAAAPIDEVPVGATRQLVVPVELTDGQNDFSATLVGPAGESESSPVVTWVLDTDPPRITLSSPKDGAIVNRTTVVLKGKTQARSALVARNEANNASTTGAAGSDGTFELTLPIAAGTNGIRIAATDPAGNAGELVVTIRRGSGKLTAALTSSVYRLSAAKLPKTITLSVVVTDPDGKPVDGADVTFTLSIPGFPAVVAPVKTGGDGRATYRAVVNKGATVGTGQATVLVTTTEFGTASDRTVLTIVK